MSCTVENPPPRLVAAAIAELAGDRVRESWRYLDAWDALVSAGVPRATIRECLADPVETEPLTEILAWVESGERGLLVLVGDPGTGKTYAQARWVLDRHRRGQWTHWVAATGLPLIPQKERDAMLARLATVRGLVLDDVGSGATRGDYVRDQLTGLIQTRIDELRSTVIASNGTAAEIAAWLGPRIMDRCQVAGGTVQVVSSDSLRREAEEQIDSAGRGPEWYAHRRIVDLVGCEPVQRFDDDGNVLPLDLDVGRALDRAARMRGYDACRRAVEALGLERRIVLATAQHLAEAEARAVEWAAGALGVKTMAASISFEGVAAAAAEKLRQMQEEQRRSADSEAANIVEQAKQRLAAGLGEDAGLGRYADGEPPPWTQGKEGRRRLFELGFRVRGKGSDYRLYREQGKRMTPLADQCRSENEAWTVAALLCGDAQSASADGVAPSET